MAKTKTQIKDILFRCSSIGHLAAGLERHGLTDSQKAEKEKYETILKTVVGLSDKQQKELDGWNRKIKEGKSLTPSQMEKREGYLLRLTQFKELTPTQAAKLEELKEREAKPPELSEGAKSYVKKVWLQIEKGFYEIVTDKKLSKGLQAEEDAINLISFVDGEMYAKNEERVTKNNLTGECDVRHTIHNFKNAETGELFKTINIIDDTKCSWNPLTFMNAKMTSIYEWQGVGYLYLYDADIFRLRYCLVDCPPDVLREEYKRYCFAHGIIDDSIPQYKKLIEQFERNYLYENSGLYTQEERVKTFSFVRDLEKEKIMLKSIELGIEYYQTLTLNGDNS